MNHIYRSVWNATLGCWVAAPETASAGKASIKRINGVKKSCLLASIKFVFPMLALSLAAGSAAAQTDTTWTGDVSNDWLDAGNWNNGLPTNANRTVVKGSLSGQPLINSGSANVKTLYVDLGGLVTIANSGRLIVDNLLSLGQVPIGNPSKGSLSVLSGGTVVANALFAGDGTSSGSVTVSGVGSTLTINQIAILGGMQTQERFVVGGWGAGDLAVKNGGVVAAGGLSLLELGNVYNGFHAPGILKIGDGELAGAVDVVNIAFNTATSSIVADFSDSMTLGANISGLGSLVKNGAGTMSLTGTNSYTGGTTIIGGTLKLGAGGSLAATGALSLMGAGAEFDMSTGGNQTIGALSGVVGTVVKLGANTLTLGSASNTTFSGTISGTDGSLIKNGSGTTTLTGNSSYTGDTQINAGTLVAAHNQALGMGNVTVGTGAALEVTSGTALTVGGDLTFKNGSTYRVYADPNSATSSHIDVTGTADLAGSVLHVGNESNGATDFQAGKKYTILTAGAISGTFGAAKSSFAYLDAKLDYSIANQVDLELKRKSNGGNNGGQMRFADLANTNNQGSTANALESLPSTHALYQHIETLPAGTPPAVFSSLSGDAHSTVLGSVNMLNAHAPNISQQHLRNNLTAGFRPGAPIAQSDGPLPASALPSSKALPAWVEVVGHWQKMDGNSNTPGVKQNTTGLFLGADEEVGSSGWRVGGSVGYTSADAKVSSRDASADISSYSAAVYTGKGFSHGSNRINVIGGLAYTKHSIESERSVATLNQNLKADYSAHTAQLFAEVGYAMGQYDKQGFEPFAGITLGEQRTNSFKESGGFAALSSESSRDTLASTTLGVRAHSDFVLAGKDTRVRASLGVRHAWGNLSQNRTMAFDGSSSFTVAGAPLARNTALVGLQAEMALSRYSALVLGYNGEYGSGSRDQSASVKVRWAF